MGRNSFSERFLLQTRSYPSGGDDHLWFSLSESGNRLTVSQNKLYNDGKPHTLIINKTGNTGSDIDFYIDNMSTSVSTTIQFDEGFNNSNYVSNDLAYFARNNDESIGQLWNGSVGVFEFNSSPYSQSEREGFIKRSF